MSSLNDLTALNTQALIREQNRLIADPEYRAMRAQEMTDDEKLRNSKEFKRKERKSVIKLLVVLVTLWALIILIGLI